MSDTSDTSTMREVVVIFFLIYNIETAPSMAVVAANIVLIDAPADPSYAPGPSLSQHPWY